MINDDTSFHPIEGSTLPPEHMLDIMVRRYIAERNLLEVTDTAIIDLYTEYCDEHPDLSAEDKERLPLTIQTLLRIHINR